MSLFNTKTEKSKITSQYFQNIAKKIGRNVNKPKQQKKPSQLETLSNNFFN